MMHKNGPDAAVCDKYLLIINSLLEKGIIIETTGFSRNQIFKFQKYTDLFLK